MEERSKVTLKNEALNSKVPMKMIVRDGSMGSTSQLAVETNPKFDQPRGSLPLSELTSSEVNDSPRRGHKTALILLTRNQQFKNSQSSSLNHSVNDVHCASVDYFQDSEDSDEDLESVIIDEQGLPYVPVVRRKSSILKLHNRTLSPSGEKHPPISKSTRLVRHLKKFFTRFMDVSLFTKKTFLITLIAGSTLCCSVPHVSFFLPAMAQSHGASKIQAALLVSICAGGDLVGRIGFGWFMDLKLITRAHGYVITGIIGGVATMCIPSSPTYLVQALLTTLYGFGSGSCFMLLPVILSDNHGVERLASSYGIMRLFQGAVSLIIPPVAGHLKDITGSYDNSFRMMGSLLLVSGVTMALSNCSWHCKKNSKKLRNTDEDHN